MSNCPAGPLHPALVHFPIVAFSAVPVLDLLGLAGWERVYGLPLEPLAILVLIAGVITSIAAALAGALDSRHLPGSALLNARLQRHVSWVLASVAVYFTSLLLRMGLLGWSAPLAVTILDVLGFALLCVGAHQGGTIAHCHWPNLKAR